MAQFDYCDGVFEDSINAGLEIVKIDINQ